MDNAELDESKYPQAIFCTVGKEPLWET